MLDVIKKNREATVTQNRRPSALLSLQGNILVNLEMQLCKLRHKMTEILTVWVCTLEIPCRKYVKNYKVDRDVKT